MGGCLSRVVVEEEEGYWREAVIPFGVSLSAPAASLLEALLVLMCRCTRA